MTDGPIDAAAGYTSYAFEAQKRISAACVGAAVCVPGPSAIQYGYTKDGLLETTDDPNGQHEKRLYDAAGNLSSETTSKSVSLDPIVSAFNDHDDANGHRVWMREQRTDPATQRTAEQHPSAD